MIRSFKIFSLISALFLTFASCNQNYFTYNGQTWGTTYHIVYKSPTSLNNDIDSILRYIDNELSMFNSSSVVSAINKGSCDVASNAFIDVFNLSKSINKLSGGVYDPTIGPLCDLWGFGNTQENDVPSDSAIFRALQAVGIADCYIDSENKIHKKQANTSFDFSSIAKGYGIDCIGKHLEKNGVINYMIEIGGEVLCKGINSKGDKWRIQIDAPVSGLTHERLSIIELGPESVALATSGNYRNFKSDREGNIYGHTLSPLTGMTVKGQLLAATIKARDCATADAVATACMASATLDSAIAIVKRANVEGLIVYADSDSIAILSTENFE
ncbi:MAG: FAD:protein FMN transferase [Muribaculaceae bacterium]|nr:FAD:protein FMN transferase [Muribaculaceae bacterium]